jgi:HEAT repeat protein
MRPPGKLLALSTAAVGVVVLVATGFAAKDQIREEWYIWRLEKGSELEQAAAAEKLGQMRSVRAVPALFEAARHVEASGNRTAFSDALIHIGKPAVPDLLRAASDGPGPLWDLARDALGGIFHNNFSSYPRGNMLASREPAHLGERRAFVRFLNALLFVGKEEENVLRAAADALAKIEGGM